MSEHRSGRPQGAPPPAPKVDILERGGRTDGVQATLDHRLFMRLQCFVAEEGVDASEAVKRLGPALQAARCDHVLYADAHHPQGLGLLTWSIDPGHFIETVRPILQRRWGLTLRPELTMLGRTYAVGYEKDLPFWLVERPQKNVTKADWPWAVWYPLRRKDGFNLLDKKEQAGMLREHGTIGRAYGEAGLATDVRLACYGLDTNDNDFVIGLIGQRLDALSKVVEKMRSTRQTSEWMESLGPFFVGRVLSSWRQAE